MRVPGWAVARLGGGPVGGGLVGGGLVGGGAVGGGAVGGAEGRVAVPPEPSVP